MLINKAKLCKLYQPMFKFKTQFHQKIILYTTVF